MRYRFSWTLVLLCGLVLPLLTAAAQPLPSPIPVTEINAFADSSSPFLFPDKVQLVWRANLGWTNPTTWPCLNANGDLLLCQNDVLYFLDPATGDKKFEVRTHTGPISVIEPTAAGTVYCLGEYYPFLGTTGFSYSFVLTSISDGGRIMHSDVLNGYRCARPTSISGGQVALASQSAGFVVLDAASGQRREDCAMPEEELYGRIAESNTGLLYCLAGGKLYAYARGSGEAWRNDLEDAQPGLVQDNRPYGIYLPYQSVADLRADDYEGPYVTPDDILICVRNEETVIALSLAGDVLWRSYLLADGANLVLSRRGTLCFGPDYTLWNIAADGTLSKEICTPELAELAARQFAADRMQQQWCGKYVLEDAAGALLVTLGDHAYLFNAQRQVVWRLVLDSFMTQRPLLLPNGNIVFTSEDGDVWCYGASALTTP